jgi:hypothetical protein
MYVVINKDGEVFTGLSRGYVNWSYDWSEAKPLFKQSTSWLLREYSGAEIIKKEEIK